MENENNVISNEENIGVNENPKAEEIVEETEETEEVEEVLEEQVKKICCNCGSEISECAVFCSKCGERYGAEQPTYEAKGDDLNTFVKHKNKVIGAALAVVAVIVIMCIYNSVQISNLKKQLLRDWERVESTGSTYYTLGLDFSGNEIDYTFDSSYSWLDSTIATYEYKVISGDKIKVKRYGSWDTFKVEFNEDKEMMIITPAVTSTDDEEYWYNFD